MEIKCQKLQGDFKFAHLHYTNALNYQVNGVIVINTEASYYIPVPLPIHGCLSKDTQECTIHCQFTLFAVHLTLVARYRTKLDLKGSEEQQHANKHTIISRNACIQTHRHPQNNQSYPFMNAIEFVHTQL